jgi:D-2-hydroxyacid dehydrogenase (NADP+)
MQLLSLVTRPNFKEALTEALLPYANSISLNFAEPSASDSAATDLFSEAEFVVGTHLPKELREQMPKLKVMQITSAGVDSKLYPELFAGGVTVATGSHVHATACAEHVLAMMLAFARGIPESVLEKQKSHWGIGRSLFQLEGKTVGIVGAGQIGQAIATRCQAFGMRTIGTRRDPSQPSPGFDVVLSHLQYHELIVRSNFIVLALPLTPHTHWIFGEEEIEVVPKDAYLFNIGRGGLIDERYVFTALKNKWLAGAGLDVFDDEPLPEDSPWWSLDNVLITPHTGGMTDTVDLRLAALIAEQVELQLSGKALKNTVDFSLGY